MLEFPHDVSILIDRQKSLRPLFIIEPRHEKTNVLVSDLVRHKAGCTATEDGYRHEISEVKGLYCPCDEKKALISFAVTAKLICVFVFANAKCWFSHDAAHMFCSKNKGADQLRLCFSICEKKK